MSKAREPIGICSDCDSYQCEEPKVLADPRYIRPPIYGVCAFCKSENRALINCTCDLTLCPDGCGCSMQVHQSSQRSGILWCGARKCWNFRHKTVVVKPPEKQPRPIRQETPEMVFDAIDPEDLPAEAPMDRKRKAAGE